MVSLTTTLLILAASNLFKSKGIQVNDSIISVWLAKIASMYVGLNANWTLVLIDGKEPLLYIL